jgi:DNA-binding XRE family transcriptional regulator
MDASKIMECIELLTEQLPILRDKIGLTQKEFAIVIGISRQSVIDLEHKNRKVTRAILIAMLAFFSLRRATALVLYEKGLYDMEYAIFLGFNRDVVQRIHDIGSE